jgi:hypothetical protein
MKCFETKRKREKRYFIAATNILRLPASELDRQGRPGSINQELRESRQKPSQTKAAYATADDTEKEPKL